MNADSSQRITAPKLHGGGGLVFTGAPTTCMIKVPEPREPLLRFFVNDEGKVEAKYEPENLTEAAQALLTEMSRLQSLGPTT